MNKGQFMIISVIIASLITISLAATISQIQLQRHNVEETSLHTNKIETEIEKITADGVITTKEERNFRKLLGYIDNYETEPVFNHSGPCIKVKMRSTDRRIETECIN
ncbi:hypothetical protein [Candidatus Nanohalobium constans]|uniref:Uncharacterized protein n=1 Tax=Candidatus Nanohalobium constans TaxID=2565781 RepID=A0A5Q0UFB7_9ARCH|nr:hypothetical protein [Candidatus Nanohalobium constans]QGA80256.1 hypothetical protein LC1Nh_0355 [Candidatus Nanohalobium constans]